MIRDEYFDLLKTWCDGLLKYQIHDEKNKRFHGGFLCPSCMVMHGRSHDAVYPLLAMADYTGDETYLNAALELFDWGENLLCDDGSFYNDAQSSWDGITVFAVISIYDSLSKHGHLLDEETKKKFESRMCAGAQWIYEHITPEFVNNINYQATASGALALVGTYLKREDYLARARMLAHACAGNILESGFLYGEGTPREYVTPRGCRAVDIGYNVEESTPGLLLYARETEDEEILQKVKVLLRKQLDFMLPDGAWDNSFGTRNYKWTYWGSRTSDGSQLAYGVWGEEEPVFAEAARRNLKLYEACTHDGLLYGGPDYKVHGELPCIHHTFCHAKALAGVLDEGVMETPRVKLPSEQARSLVYYPDIDTYKLAKGGFRATVTGYDFQYMPGGHASGGALTMLWHEKTGPIIASSMTRYSLKEAHNMQLSVKKSEHVPLTPGVELVEKGVQYAQFFDYNAHLEAMEREAEVRICADARLVDISQKEPENPVSCHLEYELTDEQLRIIGSVQTDAPGNVVMKLPIIGRHEEGCEKQGNSMLIRRDHALITVRSAGVKEAPVPVFFLTGGFEAWMFTVEPDEEGKFTAAIEVR